MKSIPIFKISSVEQTIFVVLLLSLILTGLYPLMDTTEARYADIARRMWALNDWITPWFDDNEPFWGKPPFSFWVTMLGFKLFGVNEFAARFFHFVISVAALAMHFVTARTIFLTQTAWLSTGFLASTILFFIASTSVMTDICLFLGATFCFYAQIQAIEKNTFTTRCLFFSVIGLSIGLLAKGPIALILFMVPWLSWMLFFKQWHQMLNLKMWASIVVLTALISLPWFWLAEQKTPGFLHYFIVGEHWQRFLVTGWQGDKYGSAHEFTRGTIWLFFIAASLPWSVILFAGMISKKLTFHVNFFSHHASAYTLSLCWAAMPMVFFSFAGNVLWTYVLPGFSAVSLLVTAYVAQQQKLGWFASWVKRSLYIVLILKLTYLGTLWASDQMYAKTTKYLLADLREKNISYEDVVFLGEVPFSARFYSGGRIKKVNHLAEAAAGHIQYLILTKKQAKLRLPSPFYLQYEFKGYKIFHLNKQRPVDEAMPINKVRLD